MNKEDWKIVNEVQAQIQSLPTLEIPDKDSVIVLECDGCMTGWGAVCKWKRKEKDPQSTEKICAYASGSFNPIKTTIDAKINAVLHALESFKIFYLSQPLLVIRTDCQAIISFFNKSFNHKPSRLRWIRFSDWITGTGVPYKFEHIKGDRNQLANHLSRNPTQAITQLLTVLISEWQTITQEVTAVLMEAVNKPSSEIQQPTSSLLNLMRNVQI